MPHDNSPGINYYLIFIERHISNVHSPIQIVLVGFYETWSRDSIS